MTEAAARQAINGWAVATKIPGRRGRFTPCVLSSIQVNIDGTIVIGEGEIDEAYRCTVYR